MRIGTDFMKKATLCVPAGQESRNRFVNRNGGRSSRVLVGAIEDHLRTVRNTFGSVDVFFNISNIPCWDKNRRIRGSGVCSYIRSGSLKGAINLCG